MFVGELRYSIRTLSKSPIITLVCLLTLAIGIGATTAVFSVINRALLKPLPFANPNRLVAVIQYDNLSGKRSSMSMPDFLAYKEGIAEFDWLAGYEMASFSLGSGRALRQYRGALTTQDFFSTFGIRPSLGRTFRSDDSDGAMIISESLWRNDFQSDPAIIGRPVLLNGHSSIVVGVVSNTFWFPEPKCQLWRLVTSDFPLLKQATDYHFLHVVGLLKPKATLQQAQTKSDVISRRLAQATPDLNANLGASVVPLARSLLEDTRPLLLALMGAVGSILLIAFVNITNLQLSRFILRRSEFATRVALGASRMQIARLLLLENLILTLTGGILGLGLAFLGTALLLKLSPVTIPLSVDVVLDPTVLLSAISICVTIGVLLSLLSAAHVISPSFLRALRESERGSTMGRGSRLLQRWFVVFEVAAAYALLIAVALMVQSFHRLSEVDVGFDTQQLLTMTFRLPSYSYPDQIALAAFQRQLKDRLSSIAGVRAVSASSDSPLVSGFANYFLIKGQPVPPPSKLQFVTQASVSPGYFQTMGISIRAGRDFTDLDRSTSAPVAVINESMAKHFWGNDNPIGSQVRHGLSTEPTRWYTIVGVVHDTRIVMNLAPGPKLYTPFTQIPQDYDDLLARPLTIEIRTSAKSDSLIPAIRNAIYSTDPTLGYDIQTMDDVIDGSLSRPKSRSQLFEFFGGIALWLSVFGLYGVVLNMTVSDTRALGIRLALGATPMSILLLVIRRGMAMVGLGILIGLPASLFMGRFLRSLLFETRSVEPTLFVAAAAIMATTSLIALYPPARFAARINPGVILKES